MTDEKIAEKRLARLKGRIIELAIARAATGWKGLKEGTLPAITGDAAELFQVDDDGALVPKKGITVQLDVFERHLRKVSPFYFEDSASATQKPGKTVAWNDSAAISANLEEIAAGLVTAQ